MHARYIRCHSQVLFSRRCAYCGYTLSRRAAALVYPARKCIHKAKSVKQQKRRPKFSLQESKQLTKERPCNIKWALIQL